MNEVLLWTVLHDVVRLHLAQTLAGDYLLYNVLAITHIDRAGRRDSNDRLPGFFRLLLSLMFTDTSTIFEYVVAALVGTLHRLYLLVITIRNRAFFLTLLLAPFFDLFSSHF